MFRDSIQGLEKVFATDVRPPKVVMVTGPPGSMKTSFCYSVISSYLEDKEEKGLYITLEESAKSQLSTLNSVGIKPPSNLQISELSDLRELDEVIESEEPIKYTSFVRDTLEYFKNKHGDKFTVFALDSLGALYSLMEEVESMRTKMFHFFKTLRDLDLVSFIVVEDTLKGPSELLGNEGFLVDGIIELGMDRDRGKIARYVRVEKMRACKHSMEKHTLEVGKDGLAILGPTFV